MQFNTKYKNNRDKIVGKHFNKPSMTDSSFAYDCDINNIVKNCGIVQNVVAQPPTFGSEFNPDFFQTALDTVASAKSEFERLPAYVRKEFDNNISKFIDMFSGTLDEQKALKGVKLGLFNKDILNQFKTVTESVTGISDTAEPEINPVSSD